MGESILSSSCVLQSIFLKRNFIGPMGECLGKIRSSEDKPVSLSQNFSQLLIC